MASGFDLSEANDILVCCVEGNWGISTKQREPRFLLRVDHNKELGYKVDTVSVYSLLPCTKTYHLWGSYVGSFSTFPQHRLNTFHRPSQQLLIAISAICILLWMYFVDLFTLSFSCLVCFLWGLFLCSPLVLTDIAVAIVIHHLKFDCIVNAGIHVVLKL